MKLTRQVLAPIAIAAVHWLGCARAAKNTVDVGTCAELQQAADLTSSGDTVAVITAGEIECDDWTTLEIKSHTLQLVADGEFDHDQKFKFKNVRFEVSSGVLEAEPEVWFTSTKPLLIQGVDGGVLHVGKKGYARFNSKAAMSDVTIVVLSSEGSVLTFGSWSGGCIYNEGTVRFEQGLALSSCNGQRGTVSQAGNGGGIFNGATGNIVFKGEELGISDCGYNSNEVNLGGAIYNAGKMTMFEAADFRYNGGVEGGAIYNTGVIKFLKDASAVFYDNHTYRDGRNGGQVNNVGTILFKGGVSFEDGFAGIDGGAIANTNTVIIEKSAIFTNNVAGRDGGAIASPADATFELRGDVVFAVNSVADDDGNCDNWIQRTSEDDWDFVCLWD